MADACELSGIADWLLKPDDLSKCMLIWGKAPTFVIVGFSLVTFGLAWWEFARNRARDVKRARAAFQERTSSLQRVTGRLVLSAVIVLLATYVLSRLFDVLFHKVGGAPSIAEEMFDNPDYIVGNPIAWVLTGPHWTYVTGWALFGTVAAAAALVFAGITHASSMRRAVLFFVWLGCLALLVIGGLSAIAALGNLIFEDAPAAQPLPLFYAVWAATAFALLWGWVKLEAATGDLNRTLH